MPKIYCVSFESDSTGGVNWFYDEPNAQSHFNKLNTDSGYDDDLLRLFMFKTAETDEEAITYEADACMWAEDWDTLLTERQPL